MRATPYLINSFDSTLALKDESTTAVANNSKNLLRKSSSITPPNMPELDNQAQLNEELGTDRYVSHTCSPPPTNFSPSKKKWMLACIVNLTPAYFFFCPHMVFAVDWKNTLTHTHTIKDIGNTRSSNHTCMQVTRVACRVTINNIPNTDSLITFCAI